MGHARRAADLPRHVDLVVLAVGADSPGAHEPAPEAQLLLLRQRPVEQQDAPGDAVVGALLLAHAVDEHGVGLADGRRQADLPVRHAAMMTGGPRRLIGSMADLRRDIPYTIRRSPRARRVRVSVESDGSVEVVLP